MTHDETTRERLLDLLADRALAGLESSEERELDALLAAHPDVDADEFDDLVATVAVSVPPTFEMTLPSDLQDRLAEGATEFFAGDAVAGPELSPTAAAEPTLPSRSTPRWSELFAWFAAAVCVLVAIRGWNPEPTPGLTPSEERAELVAAADDLIVTEWVSPDGSETDITGDVVWSPAEQTGFMRFRGLPVNDPTREQYQLWIFDAERDDKYPVDGGVFDIAATDGDVVVPIAAKIAVSEATLFAITIEKPGGVVVSDRSRLPVLAKVEKS